MIKLTRDEAIKSLNNEFVAEPEPTNDLHEWEAYEKQLDVEYVQCLQEGKDIEQYKELIYAVHRLPQSRAKKLLGDAIYQLISTLGQKEGYKYLEPSSYAAICALRDGGSFSTKKLSEGELNEKIKGAWYGRICGCLLGKPVEGIGEDDLNLLLRSSGNYPMRRYIKAADLTEEIINKSEFGLSKESCWGDRVDGAPADDDTNYTVINMLLVEKHGRNFSPENVCELWSRLQPRHAYCTAERVSFLNYIKGFLPPYTAVYKNHYREWIGAQIRGDYFGYINPGNPEAAAEMAFRDASISHTKNGIYGEMFAAAMIAAAFVCDDIEQVVRAGLSQIPATSRLYEDVSDIIRSHAEGKGFEDCRNLMRAKYPPESPCSWCHTNSNAMIVTMSLLCNGGDYGRSICSAVQAVYDTDCNGATVGSVLGAMNGFSAIPEQWIEPINGRLSTQIVGFESVSIDELVRRTCEALRQ